LHGKSTQIIEAIKINKKARVHEPRCIAAQSSGLGVCGVRLGLFLVDFVARDHGHFVAHVDHGVWA
jgi:hypothetical protein